MEQGWLTERFEENRPRLRGVAYRPSNAVAILRRNLLIYGVGGVIVPFPAIWLIDRLIVLLRLA